MDTKQIKEKLAAFTGAAYEVSKFIEIIENEFSGLEVKKSELELSIKRAQETYEKICADTLQYETETKARIRAEQAEIEKLKKEINSLVVASEVRSAETEKLLASATAKNASATGKLAEVESMKGIIEEKLNKAKAFAQSLQ